jgi:pyruvate kinase
VGLDLITAPVKSARKTKIVCTLGPSCWSEAGLAALMDAGMNVARFNFSHGDHAGHGEVLTRLRKVGRSGGGGGDRESTACRMHTALAFITSIKLSQGDNCSKHLHRRMFMWEASDCKLQVVDHGDMCLTNV